MTHPRTAGHHIHPGHFSMKIPGQLSAEINTVPLLTAALIDNFGWRGAYIGLALLALLTGGLASTILILRDSSRSTQRPVARPSIFSAEARGALVGGTFWRIALMSLLVTLGVIGLAVHFVAICADRGIDRADASTLAELIGIAGLIGRLGTGVLLDRFNGRTVGALIFLVPTAACLFLWLGAPGLAGMALIALAVGASLGAELDIMAFLAARYFPLADYGVLFGVLTGIFGCAACFGPLFASLLRDMSGS